MRIAPSAACCLILLGLVGCSTRPTESAAAPTAAPTATASGPVELREGSKVKVALVSGGAHPYFQPWKEAARQSAANFQLGGVVFNETAEWDQAKQNNLLDSLAAQGYNAFGVFGVSPTDINTTFGDLKSKGFAVASLASCPAGDTNEADFCLSTDVEVAAYKAAKAAVDAMGGKGVLVHLTGNNVDANTQRRIKGVDKAVEETSGAVKLLPVVADVDKDLQTAQKAVADLLAARGKEIGGIVSTAYNPAVAAAAGVKKAGLPIKVVAIDDDPEILRAIREGSAYATIAQNPRGQAYVGSWALALLQSQQCTMRQPGVVIDSGSFLVTKENVDGYDTERRKTSEQIKQRFAVELLSCR